MPVVAAMPVERGAESSPQQHAECSSETPPFSRPSGPPACELPTVGQIDHVSLSRKNALRWEILVRVLEFQKPVSYCTLWVSRYDDADSFMRRARILHPNERFLQAPFASDSSFWRMHYVYQGARLVD